MRLLLPALGALLAVDAARARVGRQPFDWMDVADRFAHEYVLASCALFRGRATRLTGPRRYQLPLPQQRGHRRQRAVRRVRRRPARAGRHHAGLPRQGAQRRVPLWPVHARRRLCDGRDVAHPDARLVRALLARDPEQREQRRPRRASGRVRPTADRLRIPRRGQILSLSNVFQMRCVRARASPLRRRRR